MIATRVGIGVSLSAAALLLAGCTPPPPDIPGPSAERIAEFTDDQLLSMWNSMMIPDGLERPIIEPERTISNEEYGEVIDECLRGYRDHGFGNLYGREFISQQPEPLREDLNDSISWYVCTARYTFDPATSGILSSEQLDYLYDYDVRWVVPCFRLNNYYLGPVPSREDFVANGLTGYIWTPMEKIYETGEFDEMLYREIDHRCEIYPDYLFPDPS